MDRENERWASLDTIDKGQVPVPVIGSKARFKPGPKLVRSGGVFFDGLAGIVVVATRTHPAPDETDAGPPFQRSGSTTDRGDGLSDGLTRTLVNPMSYRYLEVTFRKGKPLAAYLYLPRRGDDVSVRVEPHGPGFLVDLTEDGRPIGIEMSSPSLVTVEGLNRVLSDLHLDPVPPEEVAPLVAA